MPSCLSLHFLGLPKVQLDGQVVATDRRKAVALLAYLAVSDHGRHHQRYTRESISALFWPEYEQSRAFSNLRRTLFEIHQALGEGWLIAEREAIYLNPAPEIDLDVAQFRNRLVKASEQTGPEQRIHHLIEATQLYRNHFLTGFSLKDAPDFNEWAFAESEELRRSLAQALGLLSADYCALNQASQAIPFARRLVSLDPLDEPAQCNLMEVYLRAGQHSSALKQYQSFEQLLRKEMNLDPQPETRLLYKKIRKGEVHFTTGRIPEQPEKQVEMTTPARHNLPAQLSTFIGREKELVEVTSLLARNRLVTLAGAGGIGKTRLSLQAGQTLLGQYPHGVWIISLDPISNPAFVPQAVAAVFEIRKGATSRTILEALTSALRDKTALLILDNCEHLVEACVQVATTLLRSCPDLKILVTSREVLGIPGEAVYSLPSLSIPIDCRAPVETLAESEAVRLFSERAALASPSFKLAAGNAWTVAEICRRVDGIPLAIELSAARLNIMQVEEIHDQLENAFQFLSTGSNTASQRQQTLRTSVDWSWNLLELDEQAYLRQLAIFAGGWTLESAEAICQGNAIDMISALVKKSLVLVDQEPGQSTRYRFHEIIRQYAWEKLEETGDIELLRNRHMAYFVSLSEQAEPLLTGADQARWIARLKAERSNLRLALEWAEQVDVQAGLLIISSMHRFWESFDLREESAWLACFLDKPESQQFPRARARALYKYGWVMYTLQSLEEALRAGKECLEIARAIGDQECEVDGLFMMGINEINTRPTRLQYTQAALDLAREIGDTWRQALSLYYLGWIFDGSKRYDLWEQSNTLFQQKKDWRAQVHLLSQYANFLYLDGEIEKAQQVLNEATQVNEIINDRQVMPNLLHTRGRLAMVEGNLVLARQYLEQELEITEEQGMRMKSLWCQTLLGYLEMQEGNLHAAHTLLKKTANSFQADRLEIGVVFSMEGIARVHLALDRPAVAARLVGWTDATRKNIGDSRPLIEQADIDQILSTCLAKLEKDSFAEIYTRGKKMTIEEAMSWAFDHPPTEQTKEISQPTTHG